MKAILSLIISGALVVSGFGQTRNVLVGTNNAVVQPTNFWSADASNARTGLGLGTAATNPASAFQPSSVNLSNLASSNGGNLTNLQATNLVGIIPASNIATVNFTNIGGTLSIASGGTGATNAANARQNLGSTTVGDAVFIATNAEAARTAIGALGATSNGGGLTNLTAANITGTVALASNVTGTIAISNGGSGATTAGGARTNFGLGATWLTNTNSTNFRSAIGLGESDSVSFSEITLTDAGVITSTGQLVLNAQLGAGIAFNSFISFDGTNALSSAATSRDNLGLGWSALTNSNAGTGLVSVNTNGEVVSPTNFWQAAPITTTFIESQPVTNFTTNITPARFLHIHSLATNIANVTNTVVLPTNTLTFEGDVAIVVHKGPTNSMTRVQRAGSTNNLITLTRFDEAVQFVYYNDVWQFDHNIAFVEPIYFSGTNAAANAAASRTNLGLGTTNTVTFSSVNADSFVTGDITYGISEISGYGRSISIEEGIFNNDWIMYGSLGFNNATNAAITRTNLGLGLPALTNTNVTNFRTAIGLGATNIVTFAGLTNNGDITINQTATNNGLLYIRRTNAEPFLGLANLIASNNVTVSNESLFRVGVSEATNKAAQFGFRSTNTNGNGVAVFSVFGYNALMMIGPSDPAAGTNPIQATVYSINPTNKVMTLITTNTGAMQMHRPIEWDNTTNSSVTRTNLGLGATNNVTFNDVVASGTLTATSTVTAKTNLVVEGHLDFTTNATNSNPLTNNQINDFIEIRVGTNQFWLPVYK